MHLFKNHPTWTTFKIGVSAMVAFGLTWAAIRFARGTIKKTDEEVLDVLMFNELSGLCDASHLKSGSIKCQNKYCARRHIHRIVNQIDQAQFCIDIAIYTFTKIDLFEALNRALRRGVLLRVISDHEMICSSGSRIMNLNTFGVEVRTPDTTAMMHHKFMVIDGRERVYDILRLRQKDIKLTPSNYRSVLIYGSANWTLQGFNGNWENCVISSDQVMVTKFQTEFNRMWKSF